MFLSVHPLFVVYRPLPNRIASATQSDCVRHPIRLRSPPNRIAFGAQSDCVRCPMIYLDV